MSKGDDPKKNALIRRPPPAGYQVGYRKPPVHSRFQSGQSGNPAGRRKGSKNKSKPPALNEERLKAIILDEAYRTVTITDANRQVSIPMAQAVIRSLAVNAAKGNQRAQRLFAYLLGSTARENKRLADEWLDVAMTYKIEWDRELERRRQLGITGPEPLPHPDHIVIDMRTGQVKVKGPMTKEEKAEWDVWVERRTMFEEELKELQALRDDPDYPHHAVVLEEIESTEKVLAIIAKALG